MIILLNIVWFIVAFIVLGFILDPFYQGTYQVNSFSEYLAIEIFKCVMLLLPANIPPDFRHRTLESAAAPSQRLRF